MFKLATDQGEKEKAFSVTQQNITGCKMNTQGITNDNLNRTKKGNKIIKEITTM